VTERNAIVLADRTDADVIAYAADDLEIAFQVFHVRAGRVRGERGLVADRSDDSAVPEILDSFLIQLYADAEAGATEVGSAVPREIYLLEPPATPDAIADLLSEVRGGRVELRVPRRGDKRTLVETVEKNARESLVLHKARRASDLSTRNRALEEIQEALGLESPPLRIECYDISHTQGTEVVGSMVVFEDGLARKSDYRRFIIRTVEGSNDVGAIREVITRRFRRLLEDRAASTGPDALLVDPTTGVAKRFAYAPGLVVVDGGGPQVAAARAALSEVGVDIPVVGLAKRLEEVWLPGEEFPLILPRASEGLYLLQRARDEAHRFAITHHRGRRSKSMVESLLDDVPGLGELRRKALLKHFGSLKRLRQARWQDIAQVPGIGEKTALGIKAALDAQAPGEVLNTATGEVEPQYR
jgi:excinuclease ABC subunit C